MDANIDHNVDGQEPQHGFWRRNRRKLTVGGTLGALGMGAGVAVAAIVLSTTVSGSLNADTNNQSATDRVMQVRVDDCVDMTGNGSPGTSGNGFVINATVDETVVTGEDGTSETVEDKSGFCMVDVDLKNVGDTGLTVTGFDVTLPPNWVVEDTSFMDGAAGDGPARTNASFQPGQTLTITSKLRAGNNAESGQISGTLETTADQASTES